MVQLTKENPAIWKKIHLHLITRPPILKYIYLKHDKTQTRNQY